MTAKHPVSEDARRRKERALHLMEPAHEHRHEVIIALKVFIRVMLDNGFSKKEAAFVTRTVHWVVRRRWEVTAQRVIFSQGVAAYRAGLRRLKKFTG